MNSETKFINFYQSRFISRSCYIINRSYVFNIIGIITLILISYLHQIKIKENIMKK